MKGTRIEGRPRNNYAKLPYRVRYQIMTLLHNGLTYDEIRNDSIVSIALSAQNLRLHSTTFQAIRRSEEYQKFQLSSKYNMSFRDILDNENTQLLLVKWVKLCVNDQFDILKTMDIMLQRSTKSGR